MASSTTSSAALFLAVNLLFFTIANACGTCPSPIPKPPAPKPTPSPSGGGKCPVDTLKLGVCANLLGGLVDLNLGAPPKKPCCSLLTGLTNIEAALCLCTVIKADLIIIKLSLPVQLSLLLNYCGKKAPTGYLQCA